MERLGVFDLLDNFALPERLEKLQRNISAQTDKVRRQRDVLKSRGSYIGTATKQRVVEEWRRRVPPADEQLDRYRKRMRESVDRLGRRWNDTKAVTLREKVAFICGVMNVRKPSPHNFLSRQWRENWKVSLENTKHVSELFHLMRL